MPASTRLRLFAAAAGVGGELDDPLCQGDLDSFERSIALAHHELTDAVIDNPELDPFFNDGDRKRLV